MLHYHTSRCPFHKYTASSCGLVSFPRKRESRRRAPWGLDARLRGHDVLLASDLRNRHLAASNAPQAGLILTQLASLSFLHDARIEPQLDVAAIALNRPVRVADANDVDAGGVLAQEPVLEAKIPDKVHLLLDFGAARIINRRFWGPEHGRGPQLCLVLVERGVRALGHGRYGFVCFWTTLGHDTHHLVPGPHEGLGKTRVFIEYLGIDDEQVEDLARNLRRVKNFAHPWRLFDVHHHRVPGDHGLLTLVGDEGRADIRIRCVDH